MKKILTILVLLQISVVSFSQTIKATTDDGRKILLKQDKTWSFIDEKSNNQCGISPDFQEPKSKKKIYRWLKRFDATTDDLKKHVAIDNETTIDNIILLRISEQKGNGIYTLCVDGHKMKYKRVGSVFFKDGENIPGIK